MRSTLMCSILVVCCASAAGGQRVPRVDIGWGIDTITPAWSEAAWHTSANEIFAAWRDYLINDAHLYQQTEHWSAAEQEQWPVYDLTAGIAYKGMPATVLDIRPTGVEADEFVIRSLFASRSQDGAIRPVALTRVYATREGGRWVFSNALPRVTREWHREVVGAVTYVLDPAMSFDRDAAERTALFADSLARHLSVEPPGEFTMIVASSPEALHDAMGVDWTFGGQGHGYALSWNRLVLSGDRVFGQDNRHEIVHYVMAPLMEASRPHGLVNEGFATWLGGSVGRSFAELRHDYARYLHEHPDITLDDILERSAPDKGWYPAGAILVDMVFEHGGWPAINDLLRSGRSDDELKAAIARLLDTSWDEFIMAWSARARGVT